MIHGLGGCGKTGAVHILDVPDATTASVINAMHAPALLAAWATNRAKHDKVGVNGLSPSFTVR